MGAARLGYRVFLGGATETDSSPPKSGGVMGSIFHSSSLARVLDKPSTKAIVLTEASITSENEIVEE